MKKFANFERIFMAGVRRDAQLILSHLPLAKVSFVFGALLSPLLVASCATTGNNPVAKEPPGNPTLAQVRADPKSFEKVQVRWGGDIVSVENRAAETVIEVVARELKKNGRPTESDTSDGRFLAIFKDFYDPAIYAEGRQLTVIGHLAGLEKGRVGNFSYLYPTIKAEAHRLWKPLPEPRPYYDPFYYDPWYPYDDPYWRRPWPYRYH